MLIVVDGELTDFNTYDNASRRNKYAAAKIKKTETERVAWACKVAKTKKLEGIYDYQITWFMKNKRKDKDNIVFSHKFIYDGLQLAGIIENDGWQQIGKFIYDIKVDKENPRVEIRPIKADK